MNHRENLKQILEQIQAELNIDAKDNWDLKQVIVDSIYKLIPTLVEEITVMQDEIDRAKLQDESFLVDTKESFDFSELDDNQDESFVDTKESTESFDFSELEDNQDESALIDEINRVLSQNESALVDTKESFDFSELDNNQDPFDFGNMDWFDMQGDNCIVGENYVNAVITATSQALNLDETMVKDTTDKLHSFDEIVKLSNKNGICLNDFMYFVTYEFLPNSYAQVLTAIGHIQGVKSEEDKDRLVLSFLNCLQNITHVCLTKPELIRRMSEEVHVMNCLLMNFSGTSKIVDIKLDDKPVRYLENPVDFTNEPADRVLQAEKLKFCRELNGANEVFGILGYGLGNMKEDCDLFDGLYEVFMQILDEMDKEDLKELTKEVDLDDLIGLMLDVLDAADLGFMKDIAVLSFKIQILDNIE